MRGLTMDYQLTVPAILRRADALFGRKEIASRRADRSLHRYDYARCLARARHLGAALHALGVRPGDRVATLAASHHRHLEAYYGVPSSGAVLHTLNARLRADELAYVATHAGDRVAIVDAALWPLFEELRRCAGSASPFEHAIVVTDGDPTPEGALDYEALLASVSDEAAAAHADAAARVLDERDAAMLCYTSGTTGRPKGVLYSHRALSLHALVATTTDAFAIAERDRVLAVVPMFHACAWGLPYAAALAGAAQLLPGAFLDAASTVDMLAAEHVTFAAGVPTVWAGVLDHLDRAAAAGVPHDLSRLREVLIGGAAVPVSLIRALHERHGIRVLQGWGMTETAPSGTVSRWPADQPSPAGGETFARVARQGLPVPFIELRARDEHGSIVPRDDTTAGELEVRGAWVASAYYGGSGGTGGEDGDGRFTDDGWFRTGDVMTIGEDGGVTLRDRIKDLVKSGGEWISSVALESALLEHPDVADAAVVAVPHARWGERPLAVVVPRAGRSPTHASIVAHLAPRMARWWLPDATVLVAELPRTSAGKTLKSALRARYRDHLRGENGAGQSSSGTESGERGVAPRSEPWP